MRRLLGVPYRRNDKTAEWQVSIAEATLHFEAIIVDIERSGEPVLIERNGRSVVAILPIEEYRHIQRKGWQTKWLEAFRGARQSFRRHRTPT